MPTLLGIYLDPASPPRYYTLKPAPTTHTTQAVLTNPNKPFLYQRSVLNVPTYM